MLQGTDIIIKHFEAICTIYGRLIDRKSLIGIIMSLLGGFRDENHDLMNVNNDFRPVLRLLRSQNM